MAEDETRQEEHPKPRLDDLEVREILDLIVAGKLKYTIKSSKLFSYGGLRFNARHLLDQEDENPEPNNPNVTAAVLLQAASLECFVNDVVPAKNPTRLETAGG